MKTGYRSDISPARIVSRSTNNIHKDYEMTVSTFATVTKFVPSAVAIVVLNRRLMLLTVDGNKYRRGLGLMQDESLFTRGSE